MLLQGAAVLLEGVAVRVVCVFWSGHAGAAAGWCCKVVLEGAAVRVVCVCFGAGMLVLPRWCLRVLLSERCVRFGAGMLVPLEGAAVQVVCALVLACWSRCRWLLQVAALWRRWLQVPLQGAAAGCRCRVLLQGAAFRVACAARRCRWTVPCRVRVQDTTVEGLSASQELGRARCVLWSLGAGVAAGVGCEMSMAVLALGPDGDYIFAVARKASACLPPKNILYYLGSMLA